MTRGLLFVLGWLFSATRSAAYSLAQAKASFLQRAESLPNEADEALDLLIEHPKATELVRKIPDDGQWKVIYAPHIRALSAVLLVDFEVYYKFAPFNKLLSNVRYSSKIFGSGHLSTSGSYSITQEQVCKISWTRIWWDFCDSPSLENDTKKHILPGLIQAIGRAAFVEGVSVFPVEYIDPDLCVFLFKLTGTRICARKL
jgi:hypothetical protein